MSFLSDARNNVEGTAWAEFYDRLREFYRPEKVAAEKAAAAATTPPATGGGGGGGTSAQQSIQEILAQQLRYMPQFAAKQYDLAEEYEPKYAALMRNLLTLGRTQDAKDVLGLAPYIQDVRAASELPQTTQMRNALLDQILGELKMGTQLTPEENLSALESIRSAEVARGFGPGEGSANRESVLRTLAGMERRDSRQQKASGMLAQEASETPDPWSALLGRPPTAATSAVSQSQAGSSQPSLSFLGQNYWNGLNYQQMREQALKDDERYNASVALGLADPNVDINRVPSWLRSKYGYS